MIISIIVYQLILYYRMLRIFIINIINYNIILLFFGKIQESIIIIIFLVNR
jgi:hypothetical protein